MEKHKFESQYIEINHLLGEAVLRALLQSLSSNAPHNQSPIMTASSYPAYLRIYVGMSPFYGRLNPRRTLRLPIDTPAPQSVVPYCHHEVPLPYGLSRQYLRILEI